MKEDKTGLLSEVNNVTVPIDLDLVEQMIFGIEDLANGLRVSAFEYSVQGLLHDTKELSTGSNAETWIWHNYDVTTGALALIGAAARIIGNAISDEDIKIVEGRRPTK